MSRYYSYKISVYKYLKSGRYDNTEIIIPNTLSFSVKDGMGNVKDTFDFNVLNSNNMFFKTYHSGTGTEDEFVWKFGNVPSDYKTKMHVYVNDIETSFKIVNSDTIQLNTAPISGNKNIRIEYPVIEYEDRVEIHQVKNSTTYASDNSDLLIAGIINDISGNSSSNDRNLSISGLGLIEILFNTLVFSKSYTTSTNTTATVYNIIDNIINQINNLNNNKELSWNGSSTKQNGSPFPQRTYYANYKRALDVIEDLSSDRYTDDGQYFFTVNYDKTSKTYKLNWKPKVNTGTTHLIEGTTTIENIRYSIGDDDVINVVIYNCGLDAEGHGMEFLYMGTTTSSKASGSSSKWYYLTDTSDIGDTILNNEFTRQPDRWEQTSENKRMKNFPITYSPAYVFTFEDRDEGTLIENGKKVSVTTDDEFITAMRLEAKGQGISKARRIVELFGKEKDKIIITVPFETQGTYVIGDTFYNTMDSFGMKYKMLRLVDRSFSAGKVVLTLEEDETTT